MVRFPKLGAKLREETDGMLSRAYANTQVRGDATRAGMVGVALGARVQSVLGWAELDRKGANPA